MTEQNKYFTLPAAIAAEGGRVGIVICKVCGAAVMLDEDIDTMRVHYEWHFVSPVSQSYD